MAILVCLLVSLEAYAQSDAELITQCEIITQEAKTLNYIDKQMRYLDIQRQVEVYRNVRLNFNHDAWKEYYVKLYSLLIYFDPSKSSAQYRPYMVSLDQLVSHLPPKHVLLRWYVNERLSRLYAFDNNQKRAYQLLELTIREILKKPEMEWTAADSVYLEKAMVGQFFTYKVLPVKKAERNMRFLVNHRPQRANNLGAAMYNKDYRRVVKWCYDILQKDDLDLFKQFYITQIMVDALQYLPNDKEHVSYMKQLAEQQNARYTNIVHNAYSDYQIYQELQEKKSRDAELQQQLQADEIQDVRWAIFFALILLILAGVLWLNYRRQALFSKLILKKQRKESELRRMMLKEAQVAYEGQLQLVRNLNHDIRVPLNALIGFSDILSSEEKLSLEMQEEAGHAVSQSSTQLLHMINNLLAVARLETRKMSLYMTDCRVGDVLCDEDWADFKEQMLSQHAIVIEAEESVRELKTDLGHVHRITELFIWEMTRQMPSGLVYVASRVDDAVNRLCICVEAPKETLDVAVMVDALDASKKMKDYEDANSYHLVHARMLALLIGGTIELDESDENVTLKLWLPLK